MLQFINFIFKVIKWLGIILREFWWIIIPLALFIYLIKVIKLYKKLSKKADDDPTIFLELKFSNDNLNHPVLAMKNFFENIKNVKMKDGKNVVFEIICLKSQLHFLCITKKSLKDLVEVAFYSQYPEIKIVEVNDYLSTLPPNIPNQSFDIWGEEYKLKKEDIYSLNIITKDNADNKDDKKEKQNQETDPIAILAEVADRIDYSGVMVIQLILRQMDDTEKAEYKLKCDNVTNKLLGKPVVEKIKFSDIPTNALKEVMGILIPKPEAKPAEAKPASAEDTAKAGELKKKNELGTFPVNFRVSYISIKDNSQKFISSALSMFVKQFANVNGNSFDAIANKGIEFKLEKPIDKLLYTWLKPGVENNLKQDFYQRIMKRDFIKSFCVLNSDELSTIYHFPFKKISVASISYEKSKQSAPPSNLPIIQ